MKFRFEFDIKKMNPLITHHDRMLLIGSCFTENIGNKLRRGKFSIIENPHGIIFNPHSVTYALNDYLNNTLYSEKDLFYYNEAWHSWQHHSRFSSPDPLEAIEKINTSIQQAHTFLQQAEFCLITLGSAWVYSLTDEAIGGKIGQIVANNHKAPSQWFQKKLLTVDEVMSMLDTVIHKMFYYNPSIKIIFTISPVRHLREGAVENNRSKAVLIQAVHNLVEKFDKLYYFPAYELVMDDLRDYRFYAEDLVHPNYQATQYVWEKFMQACISSESLSIIEELKAIELAFQHKPFNPNSKAHLQFKQSFLKRCLQLHEQYPFISLDKEILFFKS